MRIILLVILIIIQTQNVFSKEIDRYQLVSRHHVILDHYDYQDALQVGNGQIAFSVDLTGLQSFDQRLGTLSEWCWHSFPKPEEVQYEDVLSELEFNGHKAGYADPGIVRAEPVLDRNSIKSAYVRNKLNDFPPAVAEKKERAFQYYRVNPHRMYLGQTGMEILLENGNKAGLKDIQHAKQKLDLWTGTIYSHFEVEGEPVDVITCCHPKSDMLAVQIRSNLIKQGRIKLFWHFPYMKANPDEGPDYEDEKDHLSVLVRETNNRVTIKRTVDTLHYDVTIKWTEENSRFEQVDLHQFLLTPQKSNSISFTSCFSPKSIKQQLPDFAKTLKASSDWWQNFWETGGAVDLSGSRDPRWKELERRIVLSQYLTAIQCSGESPPQETGLFKNSWYGKFHLEMIAWHGVHFMLWNRKEMLENWMNWLATTGMRGARERAERQGYKGVRWNKMTDKYASWESPSEIGPYRITQQGHVIFLAELLYQMNHDEKVLDQYSEMVFKTADFMANFVTMDDISGRYVLGPPVQSGAETVFPPDAQNPAVGLSYWAYGLETAQKWRERLNLPGNKQWDNILQKLALPPIKDSVYINMESHPDDWSGRPAWLEAYGCMPGTRIDRVIMENTYNKIAKDYAYWENWIWGCDFPMLAMCAARLGKPQEAVDWLLYVTERNTYLPNGTNIGGPAPYFPANGGLLWAVAMMCTGWDGGPDIHAPGFPQDGNWQVKWEGLNKLP